MNTAPLGNISECRFLLIGAGRLSRHLEFYLTSLGHRVDVVSARAVLAGHVPLETRAHAVLYVCRDRDIEDAWRAVRGHVAAARHVHCSGARVIPGLPSWHPLASFSTELFAAEFYPRIPFVGSPDAPGLDELVPGLRNPQFRLRDEQRPLYHALCVLSGNVAGLLWNHVDARFAEALELPAGAVHAFAESCLRNFVALGAAGQTGPLTRGDRETLDKNLRALTGDPFREVLAAALGAVSLVPSSPQSAAPASCLPESRSP